MRTFKLRGHERVPLLRKVSIRVVDHGRTADGYTIDLSRSGIKVATELPLAAGDLIEMTWDEGDPAVKLGGRVIHIQAGADSRFVGVRFDHPLCPEAFRAFRASRDYERVPYLREVSIHIVGRGCTAGGRSIDLSRSGIKVATELPLAVGDLIEMTWDEGDPAVKLGGRVIHAQAGADDRFVGVRFDHPLSPEAFQALREYGDGNADRLRRSKSAG